jgi:predicted AAA+ superfamily ATPase
VHYLTDRPQRLLAAYVGDYLKEEVAAEGLVRNLPAFSSFLDAAALSDGEIVNFANIARECGVSGRTVKGYFGILEDTLVGHWLPSYTRRPKRRVIVAPKFYVFDVGVVNHLARRGRLEPRGELFGKAFENWVFHELRAASAYRETPVELSYWRLASGIEVDFIVGRMEVAIEAKATARVTADHLRGLLHLHDGHPGARRVLVCLESKRRVTDDGIEILPASSFTAGAGELLAGAG